MCPVARGRGGAVLRASRALAGGPAIRAAASLPVLNRFDELALAHPAGAGDTHLLGDPLQVSKQHAGEPGTTSAGRLVSHRLTGWGAVPRAAGRSRRERGQAGPPSPGGRRRARAGGGDTGLGRVAGGCLGRARGAGEEFGGVAHEGSFPGSGRRPRMRPVDPVSRSGESAGPGTAVPAMPIPPRHVLSPVPRSRADPAELAPAAGDRSCNPGSLAGAGVSERAQTAGMARPGPPPAPGSPRPPRVSSGRGGSGEPES